MPIGQAVQLLVLETFGLAVMVLALFWLRRRISLTPLYVSLGVFQPVQVLLTSSVYVELWAGVWVSPGTVMFAASLLAVLLVYIREDAVEARKVIYGIIGANLSMTLVMFMAGVQLQTPGTSNLLNLAPEIFSQGARVTAVGTSVFLLDVVLLILLYTTVRRYLPRQPFLRVFVTMAGVLVFDAVAFSFGAFFERADFRSLLVAAVLSKLLIAFFFSLALTFYLRFIEPSEIAGAAPNHPMRDFFYAFTYREKFELQSRRTDEIEARLDKAQQVARMGFLDWNLSTGDIYWSDEMVRLMGFESGENVQTIDSTVECLHPDDRDFVNASLERAIAGEATYSIDHRMIVADGTTIWVHAEGEMLDDGTGRPERFLGTVVDITQRKRDEADLRLRQRALDASANGVVICDAALPGLPIIYVNPAFETITGYETSDVLNRSCAFLHGTDREQPGLDVVRSALNAQVDCRVLLRNYRKDGTLFWNELHIDPVRGAEGTVTHFVGIQNDVTERVEQQEGLVHRANHDELTGLANRRAIREALDAALGDGASGSPRIGVIVLNIDRLHHVNDTLGYSAGDQVLAQVAERLGHLATKLDCTAARIGGDEFLLMTGPDLQIDAFERIARGATNVLSLPYAVNDQSVYLTCSAGVSWSPDAGHDAAQLLGQADLALNLAKQRGRNQVVLYSAERSASLADRIVVGAEMREALQRGEIQLHYQPVVAVQSGTIVGAEALMRWNSARLGPIAPSRFIPIAEDTGMIVRLGDWALRTAIAQLRAWHAAGGALVPLSVNVSAVQFQRPEFIAEIEDALAQAGVAPGLLKIEITESVVMEDAQTAVMMLNRLKQLGVRISLDDFGTGHSSLGYLRQLPIDEIKIDQSFVRDVVTDSYAATLCRAIIAMSQQLQFTVVAEGVETEDQARFLKDAGCQLLQGFLFSRPLPAENIGALLGTGVRWGLDGRRAV